LPVTYSDRVSGAESSRRPIDAARFVLMRKCCLSVSRPASSDRLILIVACRQPLKVSDPSLQGRNLACTPSTFKAVANVLFDSALLTSLCARRQPSLSRDSIIVDHCRALFFEHVLPSARARFARGS
jgi:hypothetical protein